MLGMSEKPLDLSCGDENSAVAFDGRMLSCAQGAILDTREDRGQRGPEPSGGVLHLLPAICICLHRPRTMHQAVDKGDSIARRPDASHLVDNIISEATSTAQNFGSANSPRYDLLAPKRHADPPCLARRSTTSNRRSECYLGQRAS